MKESQALIEQIKREFQENRNETDAGPMAAYLKNKFSFLGLKRPVRDKLQKPFIKEAKKLSEKELISLCYALYKLKEREFHYLAVDLLKTVLKKPSEDVLEDLYFFITHHSWWDTVDSIAANPLGKLVSLYPSLQFAMDKWIKSNNFWVRRSAILYQLKYKEKTDFARLSNYCMLCANENEFFIRKAIGWALREYSKTNPEEVKNFVEHNKAQLSPLSIKEATRLIK